MVRLWKTVTFFILVALSVAFLACMLWWSKLPY
jgi:hypothetical protein